MFFELGGQILCVLSISFDHAFLLQCFICQLVAFTNAREWHVRGNKR